MTLSSSPSPIHAEIAQHVASPVRADGSWVLTWRDWRELSGYGRRTVRAYVERLRAYHTGMDLNHRSGVDRGRSVFAVADGVVCFAGDVAGWRGGDVVVIRHEIGGVTFYSRYAHVEGKVAVGALVRRGDLIAYIADYPPDGHAGDHLHFDVSTADLCARPGLWHGLNIAAVERDFVDPMLFARVGDAQYRVARAQGASVRVMPIEDAPIVGIAPQGSVIEAREHDQLWLEVRLDVAARIGNVVLAQPIKVGYVLKSEVESIPR